jgi:Eukaryotic elongation factor 5A hypusine, DNA-binding OB fold
MSLEQRCQLFHDAALGVGRSKGEIREIGTLRKFMHNNQGQRFTDKGVSRLFDTIQIYVHKEGLDKSVREGLVEDALKMPFTVFSTKQKKSMLKWLEALRGSTALVSQDSVKVAASTQLVSLIDLVDNKMSLMDTETGDTYDDVPLPTGELGTAIAKAFDDTESAVVLKVTLGDTKVECILGMQGL